VMLLEWNVRVVLIAIEIPKTTIVALLRRNDLNVILYSCSNTLPYTQEPCSAAAQYN